MDSRLSLVAAGIIALGNPVWRITTAQDSPRPVRRGCSYGNWSRPTQFPVDSSQRLDDASAASGPGVSVAFGSPSLVFRRRVRRLNDRSPQTGYLRAFTFQGKSLGSPAGPFAFVFPRGAVDGAGNIHVVWGEPVTEKMLETAEYLDDVGIGSIWYSVFRKGAWSQAIRVYEASYIRWDPSASSQLVLDPNGGLHLAIVASFNQLDGSIVYLNSNASIWKPKRLGFETAAAYVDLAVGKGNEVGVTFVAAPPPSPDRRWRTNGMFLLASRDRGASWSAPKLVAAADQIPAYEPRIMFDTNGRLHTIWTNQSDTSGLKRLWHQSSPDLGRTWGRAAMLQIDATASRTAAVTDRCGTIHVLLQSTTGSGPRIGYTRFLRGSWTLLVTLFGERLGALPRPLLNTDGTVQVLFYSAPFVSDASLRYRPFLSTLRSARDR